MKTIRIITFIFLISAGSAFQTIVVAANNHYAALANKAVQPPQQRTPEDMAKHETERMKSDLALTTEQLPKVDSLNLKYAKKMRAAMDQNQGDREGMRAQREEMNKLKRAELESILTADQLKKYDEIIVTRRQQMQNRAGN